MIDHLADPVRDIRHDGIKVLKVLYEVGCLRPDLIAPYGDEFAALRHSQDNLHGVAWYRSAGHDCQPETSTICQHIDTIIEAVDKGSVIVRRCCLLWNLANHC